MMDISESRIASCRKHVVAIALSLLVLSAVPDILLAQLECGNVAPVIGCGQFVQVAPDSFVADFSQCLDSKGRDNRGLVVRLDTQIGSKFKCQLASIINNDPLLAFETGFYRIEADLEYNRPDDLSQANESFFIEIVGQDTTGPCGLVNVRDRFDVIPDTLKFANVTGDSVRTVRDLGLFHLNAGQKIFFKHYQILLDPTLTPNPTAADSLLIQRDTNGKRRFGEIESVHMFRMSLTRVALDPILTLTKNASRDEVTPGGRVDYELNLRNTSDTETARTLRVTDILPPDVILGSVMPNPTSIVGDTLVWLFPKLKPLENLKFQYNVTVPDTFQNSNLPVSLVNTSSVFSSCGNAADTARVMVIPACDVDLSVSADADTAFPGQTLTYSLDFVNNGPVTAFDGRVTAILPPLVSNFASSIPPASVAGDTIIWTFDSLAVGVREAISYQVTIAESVPSLPVLLETDVLLEVDCGSDSAQTNVVVVAPPPCDLSLRQSAGSDTVIVGDILNYALIFGNGGPAIATDFQVLATIPDSLFLVDASPPPTEVRGDTIIWNLDSLAVSASDTIIYNLRVPNTLAPLPRTLSSTSVIFSSCGSDTAFSSVVAIPVPPCDILVTLSSTADSVIAGESLNYTVGLSNRGPALAPGLTVVATFSDSVLFSEASLLPILISGTTISWLIDSLAVDVSDSITFKVEVPQGILPLPTLLRMETIAASECGSDTSALAVSVVPPPPCDLSIAAISASDTAVVGETVNFDLVVANHGPADAFDLDLISSLPQGLVFVSASPPPGVSAGGDSLFWHLDSLQVGETDTIFFQVQTVSDLVTLPQTLTLTNSVTSSCGGDTSETSLTVVPPPPCDLALVNLVSTDSVIVGNRLTYQLILQNGGPAQALDVNIFTALPAFAALVTARPGPVLSANQDSLFWNLDSLAVGQADTFFYEVEISKNLTPLPQVLESLSAATSSCGADTISTAVVAVAPPPCLLDLSNTASVDTVIVGNQLSFTLFVQNQGPAAAPNLVVFSVLPDSVTFVSAVPEPSTVTDDTLFWNFDWLSVGAGDSITYSVQIAKTLSPLPQVIEIPSVASSECGADTAVVRTVVIPPLPCDLNLVNTSRGDSVIAGGIVDYDLHLSNFGPVAALDVSVVTTLPDSVEFLGASISSIVAVAGGFVWTIDSLAVGSVDSISYRVRIPATFSPVPQTIATLSIAGSACGTDTSRATVTVVPPPPCLLNLTTTASSDTVYAGDTFGYTLRIANAGPAGAPTLDLFATLPDSSQFVRASIEPIFSMTGDTLFWRLDSLAAGEEIGLDYEVSLANSFLLSPLSLVSNSGVSTSCGGDTTTTFVTAIDTTVQCRLLLSVATAEDTVKPGATVVTNLTVENAGPDEAPNVVAIQVLPRGLTFVSSSPLAQATGDTLIWTFDSIAPGTNQTITLTTRVDEALASLPRALSTSILVMSDCDTVASSVALYISPFAYDLHLTKSVSPEVINQNELLTYTLRIDNLGPDDATDVRLVDVLPDSFEVAQFLDDLPDSSGNILQWRFPLIMAGRSAEVSFTARFDPSQPLPANPLTIGNLAYVSSMFDTNPPNDTSSIFVDFRPDLMNCKELFRFDRNVFQPDLGTPIEMSFEIDSPSRATLNLYDITGYLVTNLFDTNFNLGPNSFFWDGNTRSGKRVGSGVYIVIFRTRDTEGRPLECINKVIVAR